ncbi:hypothetical protein RchiOBHm_Chr7g0215181 [Rosa chinensis]|uniref:Uncharacterized protein n=1 Tax=Rosa chinensis TaxID=74649 RepID=A0A2P6PBE5_ROSCH|nr:hypothetical protein RchiOBHm_Chr7g0215181 [Rosa chinensis]
MPRSSRALLGLGEHRPRAWPLCTYLSSEWSAITASSLGSPKTNQAIAVSSRS